MSKKKNKQEQKQKDKMKETKKLHKNNNSGKAGKNNKTPAFLAISALLLFAGLYVGEATKPLPDGWFSDLSATGDVLVAGHTTLNGNVHINDRLYYAPTDGINCNGNLYVQNDQILVDCWEE